MISNILLTSAGRRVELLRSLQAELVNKDHCGQVFSCDLRPKLSSACVASAKAFEAPRLDSAGYGQWLLETSIANDVGLIIPTIDTELLLLSRLRDSFEKSGITVVVSSQTLIQRCRDKRLTSDLFAELGIPVPRLLTPGELEFPCFVKPYDGSCSVGAKKLNRAEDLTAEILNDDKLMFIEYMDTSFSEYTVDCYYDRESNLKCLVPRERIEVRAGEVSKGITRKNWVYKHLSEKLCHITGARGCLTFQFFVKDAEQQIYGIELNPRFGGGFPLSYAARANFPGWLISEYLYNETDIPFFEDWESELLMLRYDGMVLVHAEI